VSPRALASRLRRWLAPAARESGAEPAERRHALVGPPRLWRQKRAFQIAFLRGVGLEPRHRLLDLGCGTLRGGIPLIAHLEPGHYTGIELRAEVLEEGRRELAESGLAERRPLLLACGDLAALWLEGRFDFVLAFSVLIHMTDEIAGTALRFAARHLAPSGAFYANVNLDRAPERRWQGFPVVSRPLDFYEHLGASAGLRVAELGRLCELGHLSGDPAADAQAMLRFTAK
jgi:SAM-dependent methyltransferase